jgi:hypothetical protein
MEQATESFLYGQGEVLAGFWVGNTPPAANAWFKLWDVGALSVALARESFTHKESRTGNKLEVREIQNGKSGTIKATINAINTRNLALMLNSDAQDIATGTVSGYELPEGVAVGDVILVDHVAISALVVHDSAGTPAVVAAENFSVAGGYGQIEVLSLPSGPAPTQPLTLAYSYGAARAVGLLANALPPNIALRYNGINLAEAGAPVIVDFWKLSVGVLSELALINNDTSVSNMPFEAKLLADLSRAATELGYFGQIRYLGAGA